MASRVCKPGDVWSTDNPMWPLVIVEKVDKYTASVKNLVEPPRYGGGLFRLPWASKKRAMPATDALVRRFCTAGGLQQHLDRWDAWHAPAPSTPAPETPPGNPQVKR